MLVVEVEGRTRRGTPALAKRDKTGLPGHARPVVALAGMDSMVEEQAVLAPAVIPWHCCQMARIWRLGQSLAAVLPFRYYWGPRAP